MLNLLPCQISHSPNKAQFEDSVPGVREMAGGEEHLLRLLSSQHPHQHQAAHGDL